MNPDKMEHPDFDASHFPECNTVLDPDLDCDCPQIEREIREDFAAARFEMERGR